VAIGGHGKSFPDGVTVKDLHRTVIDCHDIVLVCANCFIVLGYKQGQRKHFSFGQQNIVKAL